MLHNPFHSLLEVTPALAVLENSSRFLLTLGVGLFIAYAVCMLGANLVGLAHRRVTSLLQRSGSPKSVKPETVLGRPVGIADKPSAVALKREAS